MIGMMIVLVILLGVTVVNDQPQARVCYKIGQLEHRVTVLEKKCEDKAK